MMKDKLKRGNINVLAAASQPTPEGAPQFWRFENSADAESEGTLYIYGDIVIYDFGDWNYPDDVIPNKFKDELKALGDVKTIHVRINSYGGSVFAAYAIMNLLKSHKAQIIVHGDGIVASAATIIAMAGDKIKTAVGSVWMFHMPLLSLWGSYNRKDLKEMDKVLDTITQSMLDIYNARTGIEKDKLEEMLNRDEWLTGTQAVEKGFVDEVTDWSVAAHVSADKQTAIFNGLRMDISKVCNKDALLALLKPQPAPNPEGSGGPLIPKPSADVIPQAANKKVPEQEENIVNLNDFKNKHPEIYKEAVNEGIAQGVKDERSRMQAIDSIALPGMDALTAKAKYETGITADALAVEIVKAQKAQGVNYVNNANDDAKELDKVPHSAPPQDNAEKERALLNHLGERKNLMR
jgi:ATP-dependent protease ClpP protease subunit